MTAGLAARVIAKAKRQFQDLVTEYPELDPAMNEYSELGPMAKALDDLRAILDSAAIALVISGDCSRCNEELMKAPADQFFRRALVRNVCSLVEVELFLMTLFVILLRELPLLLDKAGIEDEQSELEKQFGTELSPAELLCLQEQSPVVDNNGNITTRPQFMSAIARFRMVTALFVKVLRLELQIDYGSNGWQAFRATIGARNRLVHPKSKQSTTVTDSEVEQARVAMEWANTAMFKFMKLGLAKVKKIDELSTKLIQRQRAKRGRRKTRRPA